MGCLKSNTRFMVVLLSRPRLLQEIPFLIFYRLPKGQSNMYKGPCEDISELTHPLNTSILRIHLVLQVRSASVPTEISYFEENPVFNRIRLYIDEMLFLHLCSLEINDQSVSLDYDVFLFLKEYLIYIPLNLLNDI